MLRRRLALHDFGRALLRSRTRLLSARLVHTLARRHPAGSTTNLNTRAMEQTQQVRTYEHTNIRYTIRVVSGTDTGGGWLDLRVSKTLFPLNASSVRVRGTLAHATRCATRPRCAYADTPSTSSGLATCKGVVCSLTRGFDRRGVCGVPDTTENERTNGQQAS